MAGVKKNSEIRKDSARQCSPGKKLSSSSSSSSSSFPSCSDPSSFFKIMLGNFRDLLLIPPRFADRLVGLVNQNVCLEDLHGNSSSVKISMVDGSLAFKGGWHDFVLDHSIDVGEFLVFKHVSKSLFFVQMFGIDACERVQFGERNSKQLCTKNIIKADLSLERSQLHKRCKTFEASKDEYCPAKKDLQKIHDSSVRITEGECVAKVVVEPGGEPEKALQHHHDPGSPQIAEVKDLTGPLVNMIGQQVIEEPQKEASVEQFKTCVGVSVERFKTGIHLDNMLTFPLVEKNLLDHEDSHDKSQTAPTVDCRSSGTNKWSICCWGSSLPLNANENFLAGEQEEHIIQKIGLDGHQTPGVMGANLVASDEVACKFLLTEEGICHIVNEDQKNGLGAVSVTPVSLTATEIGTRISCNYSDTMSKDAFSHLESVYENGHVPGNGRHACGKTMHACEDNGNTPGFLYRKELCSSVGSVGCILQDVLGTNTAVGNKCQSVEDKEENAFCMRSQNLKAVKIENMDLDNLSSATLSCLSLTLSSNTRCLLELPQKLPVNNGKKRQKVIILRDPSHRSWPVMYHESTSFIGFTSGWNEFATANNLQWGHMCEFFVVDGEFEPTFQVQISRH
ncbi:B3 DNA binding domain [Musa troglodytarum]|uniref:B3 DNA binding domain n=1 Tax=Musa troglodytarum TaxID=320322 RepID=A0A9E7GBT2_9LILI|nr:B3 DNA binding domain [Musa troglodytarum]